MKASIALALGVAALLAIAGTAGYVVLVNHGQLFPSSGTSAGGVGSLSVYVQDAPTGAVATDPMNGSVNATATFSHVYVTFSEVQVHQADAGNDSGWVNVTTTKTVDLMSTVSVSGLLGTAQVPSGMYTQLRLNVTKAWGVFESNNTTVNFIVPSGVLKTDDPFNVTTGQSTSLTIEIDLNHDIVHADGMWLFTPVLGPVKSS